MQRIEEDIADKAIIFYQRQLLQIKRIGPCIFVELLAWAIPYDALARFYIIYCKLA